MQSDDKPGRVIAAAARRSSDPDKRRQITIRVSIESWKKLKILSLETDSTLQDLAIDGYNRILKEHGISLIDESAMSPPPPETQRPKKG